MIRTITFRGRIENAGFICTVKPPIPTNPDRKRSFSKVFSKPEEFENVGFVFWFEVKHFENVAFRKR